jgi:hypothetical protein
MSVRTDCYRTTNGSERAPLRKLEPSPLATLDGLVCEEEIRRVLSEEPQGVLTMSSRAESLLEQYFASPWNWAS